MEVAGSTPAPGIITSNLMPRKKDSIELDISVLFNKRINTTSEDDGTMAENDIYKNKEKYERYVRELDLFGILPEQRPSRKLNKNGKEVNIKGRKSPYYCRFKDNLQYFQIIFKYYDARDTSYIRRARQLTSLRLICHFAEKDLKDFTRDDIDNLVAWINNNNFYKTCESREGIMRDIKWFWKVFFPEKDSQGRPDNTIIPYPVRHLKVAQDKSKEKRRIDKLSPDEIERIINFFTRDPRVQFYITLAVESLGRPQEILYTKIKDVELYDNYAKIWISEHGKEGTGYLQCIDSYPYLVKWLEHHPFKNDKDSYLFVNLGVQKTASVKYSQFTPFNLNKKLRFACKELGINKPITGYSLKRSGVTIKRLMGYSDVEIQKTARWTSTAQLKIYDLSTQDDVFKQQLIKRGLLKDDSVSKDTLQVKICDFCNTRNGFTSQMCSTCKRPLDKELIRKQLMEQDAMLKKVDDMENKYKDALLKMSEALNESKETMSLLRSMPKEKA